MGKKIKKGVKGEASKYITRSKALKNLKLSLKEFRRLCILKGIFPKEPKRKFKGQNKTYYLSKDIRFLSHEKLINKFREINAFRKKIKKAKAKAMKFDYKNLKENIPRYSLSHIIKERYPRFSDALNDLDDALSLISLFNILPKHELHNISSEMTDNSKRLLREFFLYLAVSQKLKRGFISFKGFYLNTEITGVDITWLVPFNVPQKLPFDIDYDVMTSFLELYQTLLKFVNYKLYKDIGLEYPPPVSNIDTPFFGYNSDVIKNLQTQVQKHSNNENADEDLNLIDSKEKQEMEKKKERIESLKRLFKPFVFYISREVPREIFSLAIVSCGGVYGDESEESSYQENDPRITHYIVDRPFENIKMIKNKEYIQPQWVFDCLNSCTILPTSDYAPQRKITEFDPKTGLKKVVLTKLPSHISPFYEHSSEELGYKPKDINKASYDEDDEVDEVQKVSTKEITDEDLEKNITKEASELKEMLLSKNKRKLLQKIRDENLRKSKKKIK
jgi:pescadillo protein